MDAKESKLNLEECFNDFNTSISEIQEVYNTLEIAFESDATVFIQSENGTGKELIASAIHYNSARKAKPFIKPETGK